MISWILDHSWSRPLDRKVLDSVVPTAWDSLNVYLMDNLTVDVNKYISHITSNDSSFSCPTIYTDIIHNAILSIDTFDNAWHNNAHFLIGKPYLAIAFTV